MPRSHKDSFNSWLESRIWRASQGEILDFEQDEYVNVATARGEVFLEHTKRKGEFHKQKEPALVQRKALDQAKADPNDPFTFARTKAHLENGLCDLNDYAVDFVRIAADLTDFTGTVIGRKMVDVPRSIKRA